MRPQTIICQRGFTLIEMVVVIVLIGLAYTLLPKLAFGGVSGPELKSNVRAVATGLCTVRTLRIAFKMAIFIPITKKCWPKKKT